MPRAKKQHLKRQPDGRYFCRYNGKTFVGRSEDEAFEKRKDYKRLEASLQYNRENPTVALFAQEWLPRAKVGASDQTYKEAAILLEKLTRALGSVPVKDVRPSDIKALYAAEYADKSDSYIRAGSQLYKAMFDAAVEDGLIDTNPARAKSAAPHKGYTDGGHRAITDQEREWITTLCADHRCHAAVMVMLYAGLRPQEVKALDIDRSVDFDGGIIHLCDFAHLDGSNGYQITAKGKTEKAIRDIPLLPQLRGVLEGHHGLVVTSADGQPVTVQAWRSAWESYCFEMEKAINGCEKRWYGKTKAHKAILEAGGKLPEWISFTVTPYDLRHSFATWCRDKGVELNTCVQWMGHTDARMVLKVYDEVSDRRFMDEAKKLF